MDKSEKPILIGCILLITIILNIYSINMSGNTNNLEVDNQQLSTSTALSEGVEFDLVSEISTYIISGSLMSTLTSNESNFNDLSKIIVVTEVDEKESKEESEIIICVKDESDESVLSDSTNEQDYYDK